MDNNQARNSERNHNDNQLEINLDHKIKALKVIQRAIKTNHDLDLYRMIDSSKYKQITRDQNIPDVNLSLINDLNDELSHHLSFQLIDYLGKEFPFFYYDEYQLGHFNIYFGNWWDHKLFGTLDVLNVAFNFDPKELDKLKRSFQLESEHKMYNSDQIEAISKKNVGLQQLQESQHKRQAREYSLREEVKNLDSKNALPWDANKLKSQKQKLLAELSHLANLDDQAIKAHHAIEANDHHVLELSKENTILEYEKQNLRNTFTDFQQFVEKSNNLYRDYILYLLKKA
ncbi:hypothetical protein WR164_07700 [Philodulcilactobacillus myokoensis]|uniref:Exonuclease SbcC n=1 Tax=Philodulcilactobacillus myokoensis TaxID=2929573 RepID=A0A9W6ES72_9LACO|nr:exonuclease SbcC [Philodulcilactobacillus myokoensis]GLB46791.1 hypothetical protein WR164_07700 [Philodulcilactobacillus myokoensis]